MGDWLADFGLFLAQLLSLVMVVGLAVVVVGKLRGDAGSDSRLKLEELNRGHDARRRRLRLAATEPGGRKRLVKAFRREDKARGKAGKGEQGQGRPTVWLLDFHGDIRASGTGRFAEEVSAVIAAAESGDEVVVRLESAGGLVHAYGLAAAELDRLREAGLATTVCVDKVAASGGYLMACGADSVRAAPLAVLGSIGVVAQVPNVHRLLKRHDIDVEVLTAGRYKRTLTVLGENTEEGREKFLDDLETTHELFKRHVAKRRPALDIEAMATGVVPLVVDYAGPGELVTSDTGFAVPIGPRRVIVAALRDRLSALAADPSPLPALGRAAETRARTLFTWDAKAAQVAQVWDWVTGRRAQRPAFF